MRSWRLLNVHSSTTLSLSGPIVLLYIVCLHQKYFLFTDCATWFCVFQTRLDCEVISAVRFSLLFVAKRYILCDMYMYISALEILLGLLTYLLTTANVPGEVNGKLPVRNTMV